MSGDFDMGILKWFATAWGLVLAWLYRGHEQRLASLEVTREVKEDADKQRELLRKELHEFRNENRIGLEALRLDTVSKREETRHDMTDMRAELTGRAETLRVETNSRLEKISDQMGQLNQSLRTNRRSRS